jgi:hypothetical protein
MIYFGQAVRHTGKHITRHFDLREMVLQDCRVSMVVQSHAAYRPYDGPVRHRLVRLSAWERFPNVCSGDGPRKVNS